MATFFSLSFLANKNKIEMWPPIGKIAAHSAYDMFSWYKYLIVNLVFFPSNLGFWSGNLFLIFAYLYLFKSSERIIDKRDGPYRGKIGKIKVQNSIVTALYSTVSGHRPQRFLIHHFCTQVPDDRKHIFSPTQLCCTPPFSKCMLK